MLEEYSKVLNEFGQLLGISELLPDQYNYCGLEVDAIPINIELDTNTIEIVIYCEVGELSDKNLGTTYELLLDANFLHKLTAGSTLGINKADGLVLLSKRIRLSGLSANDFKNIVANFVNAAEVWKETLRDVSTPHKLAEQSPMDVIAMMKIRA